MRIFRSIVFLSLIFSFTDCTILLPGNNQWDFSNLASVGTDADSADSDYFYVDINTSYYNRSGSVEPLYEISTSEKYGDSDDNSRDSVSNCEIKYDGDDAGSTEDTMCILDIMEQDFYVGAGGNRELVLTYNVPRDMCSLLTISPPWHYNQRVGLGYRYIHGGCEETKGTEEEEETISFACAGNNEEEVSAACAGKKSNHNKDGVICSEEMDAEKACGNLNLDLTNIGLGNCCFGNYRDESGTINAYNGDFGSCIGGPGRHSWEDKADVTYYSPRNGNIIYANVPATRVIQVSDEGLKDNIDIKGVLEVTQQRRSYVLTNYVEDLDVRPNELRKIKDNDLHKIFQGEGLAPRGNPLWTFSCLDSAGEIVHRLHLMVREWNTKEAFMDFYDSQGEEIRDGDDYGPDVEGIEGNDCAYEDRELFEREPNCNDFTDLEDFFKGEQIVGLCETFGGTTDACNLIVESYPHTYYNQ